MFYKIGLNNKGMSAVEVLITFTLVAIISVSLLNVVMTYKDREETESYKQEIITYKNNITKMIEDDATKYIIKKQENYVKNMMTVILKHKEKQGIMY